MSYTLGGIPQVIRTYPKNLAKDIDSTISITVEFNTDIDRDYLDENFHVHDVNGNPIRGEIVYGSRLLTFTPTNPFTSLDTIRVQLVGDDLSGKDLGVRNVLGEKMKGDYNFSFTIATSDSLPTPVLVFPTSNTIIKENPRFDWKPVNGADYYQLQVSKFNTMNPIYWPPKWEDFKVFDTALEDAKITTVVEEGTYYILRETIDPTMQFEEGLYYWRMRAVSEEGVYGDWSTLHNFYIDKQEIGLVSEEDSEADEIVEFDDTEGDQAFEVLSVFPEDAFSNVGTNLKTIYVHVLGEYSKDDFNDDVFEIIGEPVDGDEAYAESIHGSVEGTIDVIPQGDGTTIIAFVMDPLELEVDE